MSLSSPSLHSRTGVGLRVREVTPSADADLPDGACRALWINDEGSVTVELIAFEDTLPATFTFMGPGMLNIGTRAVRIAGTSATDILAIY